jgi:N-acyl-L-homoserine lactone synthetase
MKPTIDLINPGERQRFASSLLQMYHDRKRVFVDELGWQLKNRGSWLELDDFDNEAAVYLMVRDAETGAHRGSVRLLPTTGPHMMDGVFPDLCAEGVIRSPSCWEISRLVASVDGKAGTRLLRVHRLLALSLVEFAMLNEIDSYVLVAESHRVPALLTVGWKVTPLSLPTEYDGEMIEALQIHIEADTLAALRTRLGYEESVFASGGAILAKAA